MNWDWNSTNLFEKLICNKVAFENFNYSFFIF